MNDQIKVIFQNSFLRKARLECFKKSLFREVVEIGRVHTDSKNLTVRERGKVGQ